MKNDNTPQMEIKEAIESVFKVNRCNDKAKKIQLFTEIYSDYTRRVNSKNPIKDPYAFTVWRVNNYFKVELQESIFEIANDLFREED